ncbi:MAG TPA: ABC transporter substrate-binding protein [Candidatus Lustribacter sp.]|jgi:NitT/TauT family transport system substrate-binding protein|nr:ABC transporter substrate-binding protein [Candidatus Lustribacter sp.]
MSRSAAMTLIAGGLLAGVRPAEAQSGAVTVRMGTIPIEPSAEAYYGAENGIFAANGIAPVVSTLSNGATIVQAVVGGDLDVGEVNPFQLAVAIARGIPLQMIATACIYTKSVANPNVVVAKASPIKSPKDLAGATIGVGSLGDFNQLSLWAWLDANGVPRASIKYIELPFSEIGAALARGTIQAGFIVEPAKTDAMRAGEIRDFADTYIALAPELATTVWFTSKSWLQKNPEAAKNLVKAIYATARWANTHGPAAAEIIAKVTKIDPAVVAAQQRRLFATSNNRRYVDATLTLASKYGMLARPVTYDEFYAG